MILFLSSDVNPTDLLTFAQTRCNPAQTTECFISYFTVCQMVMNMIDER